MELNIVTRTSKLFLLAACIETSAPLCDTSTKIDIPGFDRAYTATVLTDPEKLPKDQTFLISRVAQGQYNENGTEIATCQVGRWLSKSTRRQHAGRSVRLLNRSRLACRFIGTNKKIFDTITRSKLWNVSSLRYNAATFLLP
jgi:hypothetical protein